MPGSFEGACSRVAAGRPAENTGGRSGSFTGCEPTVESLEGSLNNVWGAFIDQLRLQEGAGGPGQERCGT